MNTFKRLFSLVLVLTLVLCLCSCRGKNTDKEPTETETETVSVIPVDGETEPSQSVQPSQTEAASQPQTTKAAVTEAPTQPQNESETQAAPTVTGTETLTDGAKTVVYPKALATSGNAYPVIVWANGTGCPTQLYISLLEALANGGYIVVADESTMTADGSSQIDSINYIINKSSDSSSVFYGRVDSSAIGACGHSQGGRSCVNAAQKDGRIRCIVSIAGASSADEARGLAIPSLFLTGTNDLVVISSQWCKPSYDAVTGRAAYASLRGGIHTTCMTNPEKVSGYALDWFDGYLKNNSDSRAVFTDGGRLANDSAWQDFSNKN